MPESITESEKDYNEKAFQRGTAPSLNSEQVDLLIESPISSAQPLIIWTPRFIVIFALILVAGFSIASLLTQGWLNGYYLAGWPELGYAAAAFCCWTATIFFARSAWIRLGAIFAVLWIIFMASTFLTLMLITPDHTYALIAHIEAARNIALLGCFICISIAYAPFTRWDMWFFRIAPLISIAAVVFAQFHALPELRTIPQLENHITNIALYLCMAVLWLRPSCWKAHPGLTFLLAIIPVGQRLLGIQYPHNGEPILFYTQIILLLFALAALRVIQQERKH